MTKQDARGASLRRGVLWGLSAGLVVGVAGALAKESVGTIVLFSGGSAILIGFIGYLPPVKQTDADRMRWFFSLFFRGHGRG